MRYFFKRAGEAERHAAEGGETTSFLATGAETDGRVSIFDSLLPAGNSAPMHYHDYDDEIFYVISGRVEFVVGGEVFIGEAGDLALAGPGVPRAFKALEDSRMLVVNAPGGPSEGFLRDVTSLEGAPTEADEARFVERYGVHVVH